MFITPPGTLSFAAILIVASGCTKRPADNADASPVRQSAAPSFNQLSAEELAAGWRLLLAGNAPSQWRAYKRDSVPGTWHVLDGALTKDLGTEDLVSRDQFGDFELTFDWKVAPGGNAGIFYRGTENYDHIYWSAPEYQLLDDAKHADGRDRRTSAAAAYALYPSDSGNVRPGDEWNSGRIVAKGPHIEHWLNGKKVVEYELWSPDWEKRVRASKFKDYPRYGRAKQGYIGIQGDHEGPLQLRNVKIRTL